jgi:hypothetical protein
MFAVFAEVRYKPTLPLDVSKVVVNDATVFDEYDFFRRLTAMPLFKPKSAPERSSTDIKREKVAPCSMYKS